MRVLLFYQKDKYLPVEAKVPYLTKNLQMLKIFQAMFYKSLSWVLNTVLPGLFSISHQSPSHITEEVSGLYQCNSQLIISNTVLYCNIYHQVYWLTRIIKGRKQTEAEVVPSSSSVKLSKFMLNQFMLSCQMNLHRWVGYGGLRN